MGPTIRRMVEVLLLIKALFTEALPAEVDLQDGLNCLIGASEPRWPFVVIPHWARDLAWCPWVPVSLCNPGTRRSLSWELPAGWKGFWGSCRQQRLPRTFVHPVIHNTTRINRAPSVWLAPRYREDQELMLVLQEVGVFLGRQSSTPLITKGYLTSVFRLHREHSGGPRQGTVLPRPTSVPRGGGHLRRVNSACRSSLGWGDRVGPCRGSTSLCQGHPCGHRAGQTASGGAADNALPSASP